jgi:hypothetical protein
MAAIQRILDRIGIEECGDGFRYQLSTDGSLIFAVRCTSADEVTSEYIVDVHKGTAVRREIPRDPLPGLGWVFEESL